MGPRKVSPIYLHFHDVDGELTRVSCNLCEALITKKASALEKHMKTTHAQVYEEYGAGKSSGVGMKRKVEEDLVKVIAKQPKITTAFRSSIVMNHCVDLVVDHGRPFTMFSDAAMKAILRLAKLQTGERREIYPGVVKDAVTAAAARKRKEIKDLLKGKVLSFSFDMATCRARCFIGLNAQFFMNGAIKVVCLICREVLERHYAINIQQWVKDAQVEYGIADSQFISISIDSARNVTRAADDFIKNLSNEGSFEELDDDVELIREPEQDDDDELTDDEQQATTIHDNDVTKEIASDDDEEEDEVEVQVDDDPEKTAVRIHCAVHRLQLGVNDFLWKVPSNSRLITLAQKLAAKLRNSIVRSMLTDAKLNQAKLDQKTRWNSTYLMIKRLLELKEFCQQKAPVLKGLRFSDVNWEKLKGMCEILQPIAELTSRLQNEQLDVTQFVKFWKMAMFKLEGLKSAKALELRACVKEREEKIFSNLLIQTSIFLDKRFSFMLQPEEIVRAKAFIMQVWKKRRIVSGLNADETQEADDVFTNADTTTDSDDMIQFSAYMGNLAQSSASSPKPSAPKDSSTLEAELLAFSLLPRLAPDVEMMEFWKNQDDFPLLREIALDIISAPVTEVTAERLFSHLKFVLNEFRSSMKGLLVEDILVLRMNKKFGVEKKQFEI